MVSWPSEAYYQTPVCNDVLWGWTRDHFISIREYIASKERKQTYPLHKKIPAHFLYVKRRKTVLKAIDRMLQTA